MAKADRLLAFPALDSGCKKQRRQNAMIATPPELDQRGNPAVTVRFACP